MLAHSLLAWLCAASAAAQQPDGARLFTSGYPSGVVQVWDVASRKELRRFNTPPGYRGSADYALLTPDWAALYVPVERRTIKALERGGERLRRIDFAGEVRVWDVNSGTEREPLRPVGHSHKRPSRPR